MGYIRFFSEDDNFSENNMDVNMVKITFFQKQKKEQSLVHTLVFHKNIFHYSI